MLRLDLENRAPLTVLVLAPHTDDGEFGCGATMAKLIAHGHRVVYLAFSAAEKSLPAGMPPDTLRHEVREATRRIGIHGDDCIVLDYEVREFPQCRQSILDRMIRIGEHVRPNIVFLPSPHDTHQDHQTIAQEAFRAFKRVTMLGYEVPWNNLNFVTSCFFEVSAEEVQKKVHALEAYRSQAGRTYCDGDYIRALAVTRGMQINRPFAEVFEAIRVIVS